MADLVYARPSDNIATLGGITSSALSSGTAAQFVDSDPATVPIFNALAPNGWALLWDFSAYADYVTIKWAVILNTNFVFRDGQRTLNFQAAANPFGTADANISVVLPTPTGDGFRQAIAIDVTQMVGYTTAMPYIRILFTETSLDDPVANKPVVGDVLLYTARRTIPNFAEGVQQSVQWPSITHRSPAGRRFAYSEEVRERSIEGTQVWTDAKWAELELLAASTRGNVTPFAVQLETASDPLFVTLDTDLTRARLARGQNRAQTIRLVEVVNDQVA